MSHFLRDSSLRRLPLPFSTPATQATGIVAKRAEFPSARESRGARGEARRVSSSSWVVIFKRARSPADIRTQQNVVLKTPFNIIMYH